MKKILFEEFEEKSYDDNAIDIFSRLEKELVKDSINLVKISSPYFCRTSHTFGKGSSGYNTTRTKFLFSERFFLEFWELKAHDVRKFGFIKDEDRDKLFYKSKIKSSLGVMYEGIYDSGMGNYTSPEILLGSLDETIYGKDKVEIITDLDEVNSILDDEFSIPNYEGYPTLAMICHDVLTKKKEREERFSK